MPNLARANPRPLARPNPAGAKTKVLLIRQPVKSVRRSDEPNLASFKLMIGVVAALGVLTAVWLLGFLGYRLGFAPMMRVPELVIQPVDALATGTLMLISIPWVILQAGIAEPMGLMLGFVLIAIPAASLGAIKPAAPGGPRPKTAVVAISYIGAIAGCLNALGMLWWMISPYRQAHLGDLPLNPFHAEVWLANLQIAAGLDVLAVAAAALWAVVLMRLAIPLWMRGLSASLGIFALIVIAVAMAMSNVAASQMTTGRSLVHTGGSAPTEELVLGFTPQYFATLRLANETSFVELRDRPTNFTIIGKRSIIDFMRSQTPAE